MLHLQSEKPEIWSRSPNQILCISN